MNISRREMLSFMGAMSVFSLSPTHITAQKSSSKILILIELQGANDGLNTVIPYRRKQYYRLRPNIAIERKKVLTVSNNSGFHPSLVGISKLFEAGECKVIEGLGYPNPILSHFESIELWERGGDGRSNPHKGWLVDPLEYIVERTNYDAKAMFLDEEGAIFKGGGQGFIGPQALRQRFYDDISEYSDLDLGINSSANQLLETLQRDSNSHKQKMASLSNKLKKVKRNIPIRGGALGQQLSNVCGLVQAEMDIPVYKVSIGSFDTHDAQPSIHANLLAQLDGAITDTVNFFKKIDRFNDLIIMTYSEFGRRASENGSLGTDHGMAAPHFLIGGPVNGGFFGKSPSLTNLDQNNLLFTTDYRSVYNMVLSRHFEFKQNPFEQYAYSNLI